MHDGADQLPFSPRAALRRIELIIVVVSRRYCLVIAVVIALSQSSRTRCNHYDRHCRRHSRRSRDRRLGDSASPTDIVITVILVAVTARLGYTLYTLTYYK